MPTPKTYTHNPCGPLSRNNKIVAHVYQKGLTGIKVTWYPATANNFGYHLESDQVKYLRLGITIEMSIKRIDEYLDKYPIKPIEDIILDSRDQPTQ